jgi:polyribonucleotide nucleotidyltransferase
MNVITKTVQLPDGRTISIETGKVAKQAMALRFYAWATPYF